MQAYTLYSSVRPFGVTTILAGWDLEAESRVDGQVGSGPKAVSGGQTKGIKAGGPALYMIEPSGLYWVCMLHRYGRFTHLPAGVDSDISRVITEPPLEKAAKPPKPSSRSWISHQGICH